MIVKSKSEIIRENFRIEEIKERIKYLEFQQQMYVALMRENIKKRHFNEYNNCVEIHSKLGVEKVNFQQALITENNNTRFESGSAFLLKQERIR